MHPNDGRVVSNFIVQALNNAPITIYGDGSQSRAFCYVDDMIDAFISLMETPENITGPVNLGNPEEASILMLAQKIIDLTDSTSKIIYQPLPEDDPIQRCPDIRYAEEILQWRPSTKLEDGLKKTISFFREFFRNR